MATRRKFSQEYKSEPDCKFSLASDAGCAKTAAPILAEKEKLVRGTHPTEGLV